MKSLSACSSGRLDTGFGLDDTGQRFKAVRTGDSGSLYDGALGDSDLFFVKELFPNCGKAEYQKLF